MKTIILTTIAMLATFAVPALAETPNATTMSWPEFVEASGCVIVDKGGYTNIVRVDGGGGCPELTRAFFSPGSGEYLDTDDNPATEPVWVNDEN